LGNNRPSRGGINNLKIDIMFIGILAGSGGGGGIVNNDFIMEITTTGASESFSFPFVSGTYTNCTINFGDGGGDKTIASYLDSNRTNVYAVAGTYTVTISADACAGFTFSTASADDRSVVDEVQQWGTIQFVNLNFQSCANMTVTATDIPDLSGMTSLASMFRLCTSVIDVPNLNDWDVSGITSFSNIFLSNTGHNPNVVDWDVSLSTDFTSMFESTIFNRDITGWTFKVSGNINATSMFKNCSAFNQNLNLWDVQYFLTMATMFNNADAFNYSLASWNMTNVTSTSGMFQNSPYNVSLYGWDVSNIQNMSSMFFSNTSYNQHMDSWVTTALTNTSSMFYFATAFNQDISHFNMSNVTTMQDMFRNGVFNNGGTALNWGDVSACTNFRLTFYLNTTFNQSVAGWTLKSSGTINCQSMFQSCTSFDQSFASWGVTYVSSFANFCNGVTLSTANYDATLIAWELLDLTDSLTVHFGSSTYSDPGAGATAKLAIETDDSWTFVDGGGV